MRLIVAAASTSLLVLAAACGANGETGEQNAPAGAGAPVHLFIHGGYWRRFSARDHAFLARPLVRAGLTTVIMNYALCPKVSLDEIVRQHIDDELGGRFVA